MSSATYVPGQAVQLSDGRLATVRFFGQTLFAPGTWVGVELGDASGKNDGVVQGERYFDCPPMHGMFLRPIAVKPAPAAAVPAPAPLRHVGAPPTPTYAQPPTPSRLVSGGFGAGGAGAGAGAGAKKTSSRPSSLLAGQKTVVVQDPSLGRRMSLNAPSPSPGPKSSRPSSIARSPTRSPTKPVTATSSTATSRTATPSNVPGRVPSVSGKPRQSVGGAARTSMGPPPIPAPKSTRQTSISSSTSSKGLVGPSRTMTGRLSLAGGRGVARHESMRASSTTTPQNGTSGSEREDEGGSDGSPKTTGPEIVSPQPTSPVSARANIVEQLAAKSSTPPAAAGPAPPPRPTINVTARAGAAMGIQKENEDLKAKLRVLDRKQLEYRDKLKALEKVQMERDKFEGIIKKLNNKMQPQSQEISELRRQLKEAEAKVESLEAAAAEQETVLEMAALDKEMAEETAEMLKEELDVLKAKLEELELETEVLREENAELSKGMSPEERASTGWLQMERNNERLREALIRLRDMTQEQEEELRAQIRSLEEDLSEHAKIKEQYEQTVQKLHETESAVEQLREQLDNALGAEDMIEDLTERNMTLSEQVEELKAIVEDLEALKEVADELEINHVQNEREMQEELDFKDAVIAEQARRGVQQEEALENMEYTLSRFRELVTSLQSDLEDMRASHAVTETESEQLGARSRAMMDLNMKLQLSAAKAQVKTIDLELRRLEAQEAAQHLGMVKLFLPDSYKEMRDSVLALLRFRRLAFKANLVHGFIRERVNGEAHPGHEDDVLAGCDAMDKLVWVAAMCGRFDRAISRCTPDRFMRYEGALFELEPVERALNGWIDGLRRDELKEKDCAAELSRTIALLTHLAETHMTGSADDDEADGKGNASDDGQQDDLEAFADDVHMRTIMVQAYLESAATALHATRALVQRAVPPAGDEDELAQLFARRAETAIAQTRSAKVMVGKAVRDLEDLRHRSLSLAPPGPALLAPFEKAEAAAKELAALARQTGLDLHALLSDDDVAGGSSGGEDGGKRTYVDVQDAVQRTALAVCSSSESDVFATYLNRLRAVTSQVSELASLCSDLGQTQEFERRPAPWIVRSEELRTAQRSSQSLDAEEKLRRSIEQFQAARQALAQRDEELSTERLKVATLEARTRDAAAKAQRVAELETTLRRSDATVAALKDDIEKQDRELKNLEADRDKWRKLAEDASAAAGAGQSGAAALVQDTAAARAGRERAVATARELDALKAEVAGLRAAVRFLREDNRRARTRDQLALPLSTTSAYSSDISAVTAPGGLDWLSEPLLPRAARLSPAARQAEQRRSLVAAEARDALGALLKLAGNAELFDLSRLNDERAPVVDGSGKQHNIFASWRPAKSSPQWHAARAEEDFAAWRAWRNDVAEKAAVLNLTDGNRNTGGLHRPQQQGPSKVNGVGGAKGAGAGAARIAARLQIRLPALADPKNGNYKSGGADVRIVGSAEWEGLQGRQAVV